MWSYYETSSYTVLTTSSGSTTVARENAIKVTASTDPSGSSTSFYNSRSAVTNDAKQTISFLSGATSSTYRNSTNTTQTLSSTFASTFNTGGASSSLISINVTLAVPSVTSVVTTQTIGSIRSSGASGTASITQVQTFPDNVTAVIVSSTFISASASGTVRTIVSSTAGSTTFTSQTGPATSDTNVANQASSSSRSTTSVWQDAFTYNSGTSSQSTTSNGQTTVTTTRASTFPTSTTGSATTSSSSADTFTTSATTTFSATLTTYATATLSLPCIVNTVIEATTGEWAWKVTTTGTDELSSIGASFTKSTFVASGAGGASSPPTVTDVGAASSTKTWTSTTYTSTTTASSKSTTSQSTYRVAQSGSSVPFTNTTRTATVSYTTSQATTLTYSSSGTRTTTFAHFPATNGSTTVTSADTVTTTWANGTSLSTYTYTRPQTNSVLSDVNSGSGATASAQTTHATFTEKVTTSTTTSNVINITAVSATATVTYTRQSSSGPSVPAFDEITIGEGWQAGSIGRQQSIGTNIAAGTESSASEVATIWPPSVKTPIAGSSDAFGVAGSVPQTLHTIKSTSTFGGFGWVSTDGSTASQSALGIHQLTTCKGSSSGTSKITWSPTASTVSIASGVGLAAESIPIASSSSQSSNGDSQFVSFSAFPST
jgi:hypothetical protein